MAGIPDAAKRLAAALDLLEAATQPRAEAQAAQARAQAEIAALTQEREVLLARIAELEQETRALASTTEEVEERLDHAMAEIRGALGR
jgi:chromosome segregation ATPase